MRTQTALASTASVNGLLASVMSYQHPELIERLKQKLNLPAADAIQLFDDVKKYLFLISTRQEKLAPTRAIDAGWHEFLMYTRDYSSFCNRFFGTFVHHTPTPVLGPRLIYNIGATIRVAREVFGLLSKNWQANPSTEGVSYQSECSPDSDCHGDGSCGGDV